MSIIAFGDQWPCTAIGRIRISGGTDNAGNSWVVSRLMSSKFPMLLVLGELAVQLRQRQVELALDWIPREQNIEADALTNADFSALDQEKRINLDVEHCPS